LDRMNFGYEIPEGFKKMSPWDGHF
jgi:hypothetical protein